MPRPRLSRDTIVDAAVAVVDAHGHDALTLAAVAGRLRIAAPSLYKHVTGIAEVRALVGVRAIGELTERFMTAVMGRSGDDAVTQLMHAYRAYARQYPHRYAAMPSDPLRDPALAAAGKRLLDVFLAVLREYQLAGSAAIHATRRLRVLVHGFTDIEVRGGFGLPEDLDETYAQLIDMFLASLPRSTTIRPLE